MAFNGEYYIKVGNYPIPLKYMFKSSYTMSSNVQDLDSYRDADGKLHRNVLPHIAHKLEFETPYLYKHEFRELFDNIRANLTDVHNRDCELRYYDEESDSYKTGSFYMPGTMEYQHYNKNIYEPTRVAFIEY
jgi:hypothetical protein